MIEVRPVVVGEGARLRELRLRALGDAPAAFTSSAEREAAYAPDVWERRAAESDAGVEAVTLVAVEATRWVGMLVGRRGDGPAVQVFGMWVAPDARRRGIGRALLDAAAAWARERGATRLALSVTDRAPGAEAFYRNTGFAPTGEERPVPGDPRIERFLSRPLVIGHAGDCRPCSGSS